MSNAQAILARCAADKGKDTYSQSKRKQPGYSDCSEYVRRVFKACANRDVGGYTTEIASSPLGLTVTTSMSRYRDGAARNADVILWGWSNDHRAGYPYSHVGIYDVAKRGTWDQYGDIPPHNGPNIHPIEWGIAKADRIRVVRFLDWVATLQAGLKRCFPTYAGGLAVDDAYGPKTQAAVREFQSRTSLEADGIVGPNTTAKLLLYGIALL